MVLNDNVIVFEGQYAPLCKPISMTFTSVLRICKEENVKD